MLCGFHGSLQVAGRAAVGEMRAGQLGRTQLQITADRRQLCMELSAQPHSADWQEGDKLLTSFRKEPSFPKLGLAGD